MCYWLKFFLCWRVLDPRPWFADEKYYCTVLHQSYVDSTHSCLRRNVAGSCLVSITLRLVVLRRGKVHVRIAAVISGSRWPIGWHYQLAVLKLWWDGQRCSVILVVKLDLPVSSSSMDSEVWKDYVYVLVLQAGRDLKFLGFSMASCFLGGTVLLLVSHTKMPSGNMVVLLL